MSDYKTFGYKIPSDKQFIDSELTRDFKLNKKTKPKIKMSDVFNTKDKTVLSSVVRRKPKVSLNLPSAFY